MLGLLSSACNNEAKVTDLTKFYFPTDIPDEQSEDGLVYVYDVQYDTVFYEEYRHYRTFRRDGSNYLAITQYDIFGNIELLTIEEVVENGTRLADFRVFMTDEMGFSHFSEARILHGDVFPFEGQKDVVYVLNLAYNSPLDSLELIRWIRNRSFSHVETITLDMGTMNAAVFTTTEQFEMDHPIEGSAEPRATGREYFGEGIGLVRFEKTFNGELEIRGSLKERISMDAFIQRIHGLE